VRKLLTVHDAGNIKDAIHLITLWKEVRAGVCASVCVCAATCVCVCVCAHVCVRVQSLFVRRTVEKAVGVGVLWCIRGLSRGCV